MSLAHASSEVPSRCRDERNSARLRRTRTQGWRPASARTRTGTPAGGRPLVAARGHAGPANHGTGGGPARGRDVLHERTEQVAAVAASLLHHAPTPVVCRADRGAAARRGAPRRARG